MQKSTFTPLYEHLRGRLVEMREKAGMTQRDLAKKLGRERSFVSRIELGERRLDVIEAFWVFRELGADPERAMASLMRELVKLDPQPKARGRQSRSPRGE